jgi:hypothetical protein
MMGGSDKCWSVAVIRKSPEEDGKVGALRVLMNDSS